MIKFTIAKELSINPSKSDFNKSLLWLRLAIACCLLLFAQVAICSPISKVDTSLYQIKKHIEILCSPDFYGRSPLTGDDKKAAIYIDSIFTAQKLKPYKTVPTTSYKQPFSIVCTTPKSSIITFLGKTYNFGADFITLGTEQVTFNEISVVFGGTGTPEELDIIDLKGKALLILTNNLRVGALNIQDIAKSKDCALVILVNPTKTQQFEQISRQVNVLQFETTYTIANSKKSVLTRSFSPLADPVPQILISNQLAGAILGENPHTVWHRINRGEETRVLPPSLKLGLQFERQIDTINTQNVIGWIPSSNNSHRSIVVCAHFDHLAPQGQDWYPGADDNASGTTLLIELAKRFAAKTKQGVEFKNNIVFAAFSAEEIGLLGSEHYSKNPLFPIDSTIIVLNFDMVGRVGKQDGIEKTLFISGANRIERFSEIALHVNADTSLYIDYKSMADIASYLLSDHYYFELKGIPAYLLTTGLHQEYHTPFDTPDRISYKGINDIINYAQRLIIHLDSNTNQWLKD
ncbi:MAG: M28 family peptidase [Bacteroidales bacterium]|jgi:hypothetical protein|nr:M28 family peptidase [Bacteroidales bacterium]MDD4383739.1 M28 family peptidase [Bacteroidales bacterium]MDY0196271.1 M28 family peptidase [Tenuifilaceae bacterium]